MLTKDQILAQITRRTQTVASEVFGGELCIREHMRAEYRAIQERANKGKPGETDRITALRAGVRSWLVAHADELPGEPSAQLARIIADTSELFDTDRWNSGLFANAVIDAATGQPLFSVEDVLGFPERSAVWIEIRRVAQLSLDLSEVGHEALKPSSADLPATTG